MFINDYLMVIDIKRDDEWYENEVGIDNEKVVIIEFVVQYVLGLEVEKKFLRKIDKRIIFMIWGLYIFFYFDRVNVG